MRTTIVQPSGDRGLSAAHGSTKTTRASSFGIRFIDPSTGSDIVAATVYASGIGATDADDDDSYYLTSGGAVYNVGDSGAVGDGVTDDLASVNTAIGLLNTAGCGVLYFPCGTYLTSAGFDAITVPCLILGDGGGSSAGSVSTVACSSATANLWTLSHDNITVRGLRFVNTNGSESAGSAIATTTGFGNHNRYEDLWVEGFRDGMDLLYGGEWAMDNCHITNPVRYGLYIANIDVPDGGDFSMTNVWLGTRSRNATSAIRQESGGGAKLTNLKINQNSAADQATYGGVKRYVTGVDLAIGTGASTSILMISNSSVENVSGDAVLAVTSGAGTFYFITIVGFEAILPNNGGFVFKGSGAGLSGIVIDDVQCSTSGTARAAISLTSVDRAQIGAITIATGFNAPYALSGVTNFVDTVEKSVTLAILDALEPFGASPGNDLWGVTDMSGTGMWVTRMEAWSLVTPTNTGAAYWSNQLTSRSPAATAHNLGSAYTTAADTAGQFTKHSVTVNALVTAGDTHFLVIQTKTGGPSNQYIGAVVFYRTMG